MGRTARGADEMRAINMRHERVNTAALLDDLDARARRCVCVCVCVYVRARVYVVRQGGGERNGG